MGQPVKKYTIILRKNVQKENDFSMTNKMTPKISVIMLTYNRERLVSRAIESILNQTEKDFEFIIVDNGSEDNSGKISDEYAAKDSRIKVIHKAKGNIGSGRNCGLNAVSGRYVAFIDDDDYAEPDFLEFLYTLLIENNADLSICGAADKAFDEKKLMTPEEALIELMWRKKYNMAFPTKMFTRELADVMRFPEEGEYDDIALMYKLLAKAKRVAYHGKAKYTFYRHEGNNSAWTTNHSLLNAKTLDEYLQAYRVRTEWLSKLFPKSAAAFRYFEWSFMISMVEKINRLNISGCEEQLRNMCNELQKNKQEFLSSKEILDFEKEWMNKYINEYWSCSYIESGVTLQSHGMAFCCERVNPEYCIPNENPAETVDRFLEMRERVIEKNQQKNAPCKGCPLFEKRAWRTNKEDYKIDFINFGVQAYCQFSCVYCCFQTDDKLKQIKNKTEVYDSLEIVNELKKRNLLSDRLRVDYAAGEIAVHPRRKEYYDFMMQNAYTSSFSSNSGVYDENISKILCKNKRNNLIVSVDAGTEETFYKVRGINCYSKVVDNLKKYSKEGVQIYLKYILLDDNCDDKDIDGFIEACKVINPVEITISGDCFKVRNNRVGTYEEKIVNAAVKLIEGALINKIPFRLIHYIGHANLKEIYKRICKNPIVVSCFNKMEKLLSAKNIIFYGAGLNYEVMLSTWKKLNYKKPDKVWDMSAKKTENGEGIQYPRFEELSNDNDAVFITITNNAINEEVIATMKEFGFDNVISQYELSLALIAKQGVV